MTKKQLLKFAKIILKEKNKYYDREQEKLASVKGLIKFNRVQHNGREYYDSWKVYAIFDRSKIRLAEVYRELQKLMIPEGTWVNSIYDCTGKFLARRAELKIYPQRIVITQWQGLDV